MKKGMNIIRRKAAVLCFAVVALMFLGGCSSTMGLFEKLGFHVKEKTQTDGLIQYAQDLTGIQLDDCVEQEQGEVEKSSKEEYAYVCLKLKQDGISVVKQRLSESGKEPFNGEIMVYGFNDHELAGQLKSQNAVAWYTLFYDGKGGAKTRSIELYLAEDSDGNEFLYLFG